MPGVCPRCLREVYFAEEKLALGKVWHNFCFSCRNCRKLLDSWTVATHSGELFCRNCYNRLFSITSVRTALPEPRISHILPPVDKADPGALSPCDSLSDCCCCCCCNEDSLIIDDTQNKDFEIHESSVSIHENQRLRGGRDEEPLEANQILEPGAEKLCSEIENTKLGARSSVDIIRERPSSSTAVAAWYNGQQSASQSVVSHPPSSVQQFIVRPSSTSAPAQAIGIFNTNTCSTHRRPGNPCRANHGYSQYSKHWHRHLCYDLQNADRARASQEHGKIIRVCQRKNFVQSYRNCLSRTGRSLSTLPVRSQPKSPILNPLVTSLVNIDSPRSKSSYPPLPPHHSPPPSRRRVSFRAAKGTFYNDTPSGDSAMQNVVNAEAPGNVDIISFEHPSHQDEKSHIENDELPVGYAIGTCSGNDVDARDCYSECESCDDERMRGGCGGGSSCCCGSAGARASPTVRHLGQNSCGKRYAERGSTVEGACGCSGRAQSRCGTTSGGCCSARNETAPSYSARSGGCCSSGYEGSHEGACASKDPCARRPTGHETCPPRSADSCSTDPSTLTSCSASACSPPCSGRNGCCPPAGCRPVRRRIDRCSTPCTGDTQSCGGGGCCGGGCRGGCGKPGQTCLPLRPCTTPPCKPHPRGGESPCMPPRRCAPQPPCCRSPVLPGSPGSTSANGPGSGCCRSASPVGRSAGGGGCPPISNCQQQQDDGFTSGSCCSPKLPAGCECLGGGLDCQRCGRKVYQAEMQIASGVPYHNICFSCFCCRKPLETLTYHENCGEIYCKQCYVRNFGPQGYGYSGVLQTPM